MVSIITVNYYSEKEILECYSSIIDKTTCSFELILVSNSPLDSTFEKQLQNLEVSVRVVQLEDNVGFGNACNAGARIATGSYLFFLNPDTLLLNDVVDKLYNCHCSTEHAGIIGPKTFFESGVIAPTIKNHISKTYFLYLTLPFLKPLLNKGNIGGHYSLDKTSVAPVINGHALFLEKTLFENLEGMEPSFFMYWEENDLCLRTSKLGKFVVYCAEAHLIHASGTSTSPYFIKMEIEKHRSQKKFIHIHYPSWNFLNRASGCVGYSWRAIGSLFTFRKKKIGQFWSVFFWYCFSYK